MTGATRLSPADISAIAEEVVALLEERGPDPMTRSRLVDAATVARELGVTRGWVYQHRDELGAVPLGEGERPRLRFDLERARSVGESRRPESGPLSTRSITRASRRSSASMALLPVKGGTP